MDADPPPRTAELVLCTREGSVLGSLPAIEVPTPWWQDIEPVVEAARDAFGVEVVVLRMLDSALPRPHGGRVTYLAETAARLPPAAAAALVPWAGTIDEQPLRLSWAVPGGPDADVAWAEDVLRRRGIERRGPAVQVRSWNLSSIWRLPLADAGPAWLKVVPPFFGHEGDVLRRLQAGPVPRLLGHDGPRILLADIEGEDQYDAPLPVLERMVDLLVELQAGWFGRDEELLAMRLPDWRGPALTAAIAAVVERRRGELDAAVVRRWTRSSRGWASGSRRSRRAGCRTRWCTATSTRATSAARRSGSRCSTGGTPASASRCWTCRRSSPRSRRRPSRPVRDHWIAAWRARLPEADPERAASLLAPVAAARQASMYQRFVDGIEPVERRHHDADAREWLERCAALVEGERPSSHARPLP